MGKEKTIERIAEESPINQIIKDSYSQGALFLDYIFLKPICFASKQMGKLAVRYYEQVWKNVY